MSESQNLDIAWVLIASALVLIMQAGFLCLEAGSTRSKNSINVAIKNLSDFAIAALLFAMFGFSVMFGATWAGWTGPIEFFGSGEPLDGREAAFFVFEMMFCGTATTIVSGAVAERMRFGGYLIVAAVLSGGIYTIYGHWAWNGLNGMGGSSAQGWLRTLGFVDFAGSTVVHSVAGWSALALVMILGPREGRFTDDGQSRRIPGHDLPFAMLGAILLWIGWLGFNGGSTLAVNDRVPSILANTVLAGSAGLLAGLASSWLRTGRPDVVAVLNGSLAGLVAITAGCHAVTPPAAIAIGAVGGLVMDAGSVALERARIDDVVGAIPVHAAAGVWGTLAVAIFGDLDVLGTGLDRIGQLAVQLLGVGVCFLWTFGVVYILFRGIDRVFPLRVSSRAEQLGLNVTEHGATTELLDLLVAMDQQAKVADLNLRVPVEPFTEVGQIASRYNQVMNSLQEAVTRASAIVRDIRDGIVTFTRDGRLLSFNPGAERIFGYAVSEAVDRPLSLLFSADDSAAPLATRFQKTAERGTPIELDGRRRDGSRVPVELTLSAGTTGGETLYTALIRDISERDEMDRMKNEFISTVSHELRTPLTSINASLGLMADGVVGELPDESRELVRIARDNSDRLIRLIADILDIEKVESGELEYEMSVLEVFPLLEHAVDENRAFANSFSVELSLEDHCRGAQVRADGDRLIQVITNLLSNAVKFSPEGGSVEVTSVRRNGTIRVSVRDHGPGIPEDFRDRVFEKFAQADASDHREKGGTGLGLSICRAIIEGLGGEIDFETSGNGTTLFFELREWREGGGPPQRGAAQ
jgi:Amt family ammonium transporter